VLVGSALFDCTLVITAGCAGSAVGCSAGRAEVIVDWPVMAVGIVFLSFGLPADCRACSSRIHWIRLSTQAGTNGEQGVFMKQVGIVLALALLVGCGGSSSPPIGGPTIDGNWSGVLGPGYTFTASFKQGSGSTVTVTNFSFTAAPSCIEPPVSATAELDGTFEKNSGFLMGIGAGPPDQVGIELLGNTNVQNNTITGSWLSRGLLTDCHASGEFTLTRM
jgi:hypothetical protein